MHHLLHPPPTSSPSSSLSSSAGAVNVPKEYRMVWLGTHHKQPLFDKMCAVAKKVEHHIQYSDICYLTFQFDANNGEPVVVELIDPGTEKTGERQMAIQQKADAVLLCYAAYIPDSFHTLESVVEDFQMLPETDQPAILLLCNDDQLVEEEAHPVEGAAEAVGDDGYGSGEGSPADAVGDDGYGSGSPADAEEPPRPVGSPIERRRSMERIRRARDEQRCPITPEEGSLLTRSLGPSCEFRALSFRDSLTDQFVADLVEHLISRAVDAKRMRDRSRSGRHTRRHRLSPSPLKDLILRNPLSIKRLLRHSKSDARSELRGKAATEKSRAATETEAVAGDAPAGQQLTRKEKRGIRAALMKALAHPRDRARVAASNEPRPAEEQQQQKEAEDEAAIQYDDDQFHPGPAPLPDNVRVNNFVGEADAPMTEERRASVHVSDPEGGSSPAPVVREGEAENGGGSGRRSTTGRRSMACVIQ